MVVAKNSQNDFRVLKEVVITSKAGFQVQIVALGDHENFAGRDVKRIVLTTTKIWSKIWSKIQKINATIKFVKYTILFIKESRTANIIHAHSFETLPAAVISKILSFGKTKILYDAHELEVHRNGHSGIVKFLFCTGERCCIPFADSIITVSDSIADWYQKQYRIKRPSVVRNIPQINKLIPNENNPDLKRKFNLKETDILFIYLGGLISGRGIERLLQIFSKVNKDRHIVFMGYGPLSTEVQQYAEINHTIHYVPAVPPEDVLAHTATADIGIYLMENTCLNHFYSLPNKLFEYILAGLPTIINDLPDQRSIIEQFNCGWIAAENDEQIIDFINNIESEEISKKKEGSRHAQNNLSWENEARVLLEQYNRIGNYLPPKPFIKVG
jgi:glycosyltransferase involved in cell wall biosynthesis